MVNVSYFKANFPIYPNRYQTATVLMTLANIMDLLDGQIARSMPYRHSGLGTLGSKLDTHADIVSHFAVPAALLMQMSNMDPLCIVLAAMWVVTGVVRQSLFEVLPRICNDQCIFGVTSDYMPCLATLCMQLKPLLSDGTHLRIIIFIVMVMIWSSLSFSVRTRRFYGSEIVVPLLYNLSLAGFSLFLDQLSPDSTNLLLWTSLSFGGHVIMAYPCYFRYIEFNNLYPYT